MFLTYDFTKIDRGSVGVRISKWGLLLAAIVLSLNLFAQTDSADGTMHLQEVIISKEDKSDANEAFNFYRSSKISGTEDILNRIEGVNLIRRGAFGMEPTLRSYSAGQINITLNGMKMYGACTDKMDPVTVYVEPGNLAGLTVQQGANGCAMGSTIGGGLNMELKEAGFLCHNQIQLSGFTHYNTANHGTNSGLVFNTNNKNSSIRLNAVYRKADDYYAGNKQLIAHSAYEKYNISMSLVQKMGKRQMVIVDFITDEGFDMGYPSLPMDVRYAGAFIYAFTHRYIPLQSKVKKWETKIYYNKIYHEMDDAHRSETVMHMDMPGWSETGGFYTQGVVKLKRQDIVFRVDGHRAYTRADMTMYPPIGKPMYMQTLPGNQLENIGSSLSYKYYLQPNLAIGAVYRVDYYQQTTIDTFGIDQWEAFGYDVSKPNQNLLHNIAVYLEKNWEHFTHRISFSYGERLPTSNERLGFYLFNKSDGYDYIGNYHLLPERAAQVEYKWNFLQRNYRIGLNLFYHQIQDYIYSAIDPTFYAMTIGGRGVKHYTNIASAMVTGTEITYSWRLTEHFHFIGNTRYTYAKLNNGMPMQQVYPLKIINTIRYQRSFCQIQLEHSGAMQQIRINTEFGETVTPAWNTFHIRAAYSIQWKKLMLQWQVALENIFDLAYYEHLDWGKINRQGRNLAVGLNFYVN